MDFKFSLPSVKIFKKLTRLSFVGEIIFDKHVLKPMFIIVDFI